MGNLRRALRRGRGPFLTYLCLFAVVGFAYFTSQADRQRIEEAAKARDNQACLLFERQHLDEVTQLRNTYDYLRSLSKDEFRDPINRYVIQRLPVSEKAARTDEAPRYCDEPHVGLPEPDPKVPPRPNGFPHPPAP